MAENNPANDRYNPPGINSIDFERFKFGELEVDELFWQTNSQTESNPWRKINQSQALNLKSQTTHNFQSNTLVYQKV
tara:strand:+ start:2472 stop:2702 length:231 start_codon:yes stop_codon:yes gene_type:complete